MSYPNLHSNLISVFLPFLVDVSFRVGDCALSVACCLLGPTHNVGYKIGTDISQAKECMRIV